MVVSGVLLKDIFQRAKKYRLICCSLLERYGHVHPEHRIQLTTYAALRAFN
jgi:hypothetical protein